MKNKKIITRVLTLLASVVLVFALAIPCFADEPTISNAEMWELFYANNSVGSENLAYQSMHADGFNDIDITIAGSIYMFTGMLSDFNTFYSYGVFASILSLSSGQTDVFYVSSEFGRVALTYVNDTYTDTVAYFDFNDISVYYEARQSVVLSFENASTGAVSLEIRYLFNGSDYVCDTISLNDDQYEYSNSNGNLDSPYRIDVCYITSMGNLYTSDDVIKSLTDDNYYVAYPCGFSLGYTNGFTDGYTTNRPDGVVPPAKTGLFGQLYYILSDAIYGENVELGSSQDFILTQMATWLTYIVVLLPILVVAIILWRVFVR